MHKTGIGLIAQEREEQIEKHRRSVGYDVNNNNRRQLSEAARILLEDPQHLLTDDYYAPHDFAPHNWNGASFYILRNKTYKQRLIIAGALIAAEIDRLQHLGE